MAEQDKGLGHLSDERLRKVFADLPAVLTQDELFRLSQAVRGTPDYSLGELKPILADERVPAGRRFAALYCMLVRARHLRNLTDFRELTRKHEELFAEQPAMLALAAEADALFAFSPYERKVVLDKCRRALRRFDGVGLKLQTAEILLEVALGEPVSKQQDLLAEADAFVAEALARYPRMPRYLAVRAQILARQNQFADARACITEAISLEEANHAQYSIRIAKYEAVRSEIVLLEAGYQVSSRLEEAIRDFDDTRGSLINLVGLLAAVLALVIAGTQLAINVQATQGAGMLMIVGGVLLLSFVGYALLLGRAPQILRVVATVCLALSLIGAGSAFILVLGRTADRSQSRLPSPPARSEAAPARP